MRRLKIGLIVFCLLLGGCAAPMDAPAPGPDEGPGLQPVSAPAGRGAEPADPSAAPQDGETLTLALSAERYPLDTGEIPYTVKNTAEETAFVRFIPRLERKTEAGWVELACNQGFCGVPDGVDEEYEATLPLSWYDALSAGEYRLSFPVCDESYAEIDRLSTQFVLE